MPGATAHWCPVLPIAWWCLCPVGLCSYWWCKAEPCAPCLVPSKDAHCGPVVPGAHCPVVPGRGLCVVHWCLVVPSASSWCPAGMSSAHWYKLSTAGWCLDNVLSQMVPSTRLGCPVEWRLLCAEKVPPPIVGDYISHGDPCRVLLQIAPNLHSG